MNRTSSRSDRRVKM